MQPIIIRETAQTISCHLHINPTILSHCICGLYRRGDKGHQEASWPSRVGRSVLWAGFHSRTLPASSLSHSISCFNTESKLPITELLVFLRLWWTNQWNTSSKDSNDQRAFYSPPKPAIHCKDGCTTAEVCLNSQTYQPPRLPGITLFCFLSSDTLCSRTVGKLPDLCF